MSGLYLLLTVLVVGFGMMVSMIFLLCPGFAASDTSGHNVSGYAG